MSKAMRRLASNVFDDRDTLLTWVFTGASDGVPIHPENKGQITTPWSAAAQSRARIQGHRPFAGGRGGRRRGVFDAPVRERRGRRPEVSRKRVEDRIQSISVGAYLVGHMGDDGQPKKSTLIRSLATRIAFPQRIEGGAQGSPHRQEPLFEHRRGKHLSLGLI